MAMLSASKCSCEGSGVAVEYLHHVVDGCIIGLPLDVGDGFGWEFCDNVVYG